MKSSAVRRQVPSESSSLHVQPVAIARTAAALKGKGMVCASESLAATVGAQILRDGGNAVDAAIAVGFALAVTYPAAGNIGGGGFMVLRLANGQTTALDFRERAPFGAFAAMYQDASGNVIPNISLDGWRAVGVPGTVDGFAQAHAKFGKLPWKRLVEPAIRLAETGFTVTANLARALEGAKRLGFYVETQRIFHNGGRFFKEGDRFKQPELAETLRKIALQGRAGFYEGETARRIAASVGSGGGYVTLRDLREYRSVFRAPIVGTYRGIYRIITMPPPSSGGIALINLLNQMERFNPDAFSLNDTISQHRRLETMRRAFADRAFYLGDPDFVRVPVKELIAKPYARQRAATIDDQRTTPIADLREGNPFAPIESPQTTHYSVADGMGNCVSVTYTLNTAFGAAVVAQGTGILLNNEMDDFAAKPGVPNGYGLIQSAKNAIEPGKRPLSSMTPTIVLKNNRPFLIVGSPGGPTIINSVFQTISNVIDYDLTLKAAVEQGRLHHQWKPDSILSEPNALRSEVLEKLKRMGHTFQPMRTIGDVQAIAFDSKTGGWTGVSDGRAEDGAAIRE